MSDTLHALVVDDEPAVRALTIKGLSSYHFACDEASDGDQALEMLKQHSYDVVVTDLRMPKRNGHSLAVEVLSGGTARPLVVVLTGVLEPRLAEDLIARGVDDITFKPVDFRLFGAKVHALCQRRSLQRHAVAADSQQSRGADVGDGFSMPPITAEQIEQRLGEMAGMLPVSSAAMDVVNLIQAGAPSVEEIARCIARDPALTVEVLRLANSSHHNVGGKRIADLKQAIVRVGERQISELALASTTIKGLISLAGGADRCGSVSASKSGIESRH